ncbi:flagellar basal body rod protein FlgC [Herbivorax sp. ANBcel31]|uniref:flagellar basal body rod protein FlgC n=1 Tax=Herbivorax sp. ANBcel31 TaxID=3069754 RepID=UPI0027B58AB8|nr:flagellar basal body rod protein FlgC [Herbivorax sp. ANBcel31]MDQ2085899.1 flagellar basal body rod protein FlgC [Herbivorax sp. ANBcel31]
MGYFRSLDIGASGLTAQRLRMDTISQNIANVNTTRTENGEPYRRRTAIFEEKSPDPPFAEYLDGANSAGKGVRVSRVTEDMTPFRRMHDPGHPEADEEGYVMMPNIDVITEMVNMISATRAYEANVTAINTSKNMSMKALEIGR